MFPAKIDLKGIPLGSCRTLLYLKSYLPGTRVITRWSVRGLPSWSSWTSLTRAECKARYLYEKVYCARGDMENRIKECQLDLYADRTSTATMRANQLRLWFASMAYVLLCALRRIALHHTPFAKATCGTIRLKLLKIGALVRVSVRRIKVAMASACPAAHAWGCAARRLAAANARASPA